MNVFVSFVNAIAPYTLVYAIFAISVWAVANYALFLHSADDLMQGHPVIKVGIATFITVAWLIINVILAVAVVVANSDPMLAVPVGCSVLSCSLALYAIRYRVQELRSIAGALEKWAEDCGESVEDEDILDAEVEAAINQCYEKRYRVNGNLLVAGLSAAASSCVAIVCHVATYVPTALPHDITRVELLTNAFQSFVYDGYIHTIMCLLVLAIALFAQTVQYNESNGLTGWMAVSFVYLTYFTILHGIEAYAAIQFDLPVARILGLCIVFVVLTILQLVWLALDIGMFQYKLTSINAAQSWKKDCDEGRATPSTEDGRRAKELYEKVVASDPSYLQYEPYEAFLKYQGWKASTVYYPKCTVVVVLSILTVVAAVLLIIVT